MVYRLQYYGLLLLSILVAMLPRPGMVKVGRFFGGLVFLLWKSRQRITLKNLDLAFGGSKTNAEKKWIAKETFKNLGASILEMSWGMVRMNEKVFLNSVEIEGLELVKSALSNGKGVLFLPSHYGNWEMMLNSFGYLGLNMHYVVKRPDNPYIDKMVNNYRCRPGNTTIYMNGATKQMEEALKNGEIVGTMMDQKISTRRGGILIKFFGHDAPTPPLVARLHLQTSAPIIPTRCYPLKNGNCKLIFGPEIEFKPSGNDDEDIYNLTQTCMSFIEAFIRKDPQYWIWGHKRWKSEIYRRLG